MASSRRRHGDLKEFKVESDGDDSSHSNSRRGSLRRSASQVSPVESHLRTQNTNTPLKNPPSETSLVRKEETDEEDSKEDFVGGEVSVKMDAGGAPKLARRSSKKVMHREPQLYLDQPDASSDALSTFEVISNCTYANKYFGTTDHALECDCTKEWDSNAESNTACGEDSDCINRATKMECVSDCSCGSDCQNRRFQRKEWANVTVFKTEKKGFGLRANADMEANEFVFEYIGEVIGETDFRRRMKKYDDQGIKHFYFMSLTRDEFVDATKKGNFGRFCNHSCNPNCYVDKWVVGDRLRMGIFTQRAIVAGEELVFNYNVDRYGADPQPCYCGEPNCNGYIGGKTQTDDAIKLSALTIEALGIEDAEDWQMAVPKKPKKRKTEEDDEEYVDRVQPKSLDIDAVSKVMATLSQCKEKWIVVKLLNRISTAEDEKVINRVVRMHGYRIFKTTLSTFKEDANVCLQVLGILDRLPRLTRNKIQDSGIEEIVQILKDSDNDDRVQQQSEALLEAWSTLEMGYRIPRVKRDPNSVNVERNDRFDRDRPDRQERARSKSSSPEIPKGPAAPTGPRNAAPARAPAFYARSRPFNPRGPVRTPLPVGWFEAQADGKTYFYNSAGQTTWERPVAAQPPPPPPPKTLTEEQKLQQLINNISAQPLTPRDRISNTSTPGSAKPGGPVSGFNHDDDVDLMDKWRDMPEEKKKKVYENTIAPHVQYVMSKFKHKIPRDDLKKFAKEASKKIVEGDFKRGRVSDPTDLSDKRARDVKKFCKDWFDKVAARTKEREQRKSQKMQSETAISSSNKSQPDSTTPIGSPVQLPNSTTPPGSPPSNVAATVSTATVEEEDEGSDMDIDDDEEDTHSSISELKRKREFAGRPSLDSAADLPQKRHRLQDTPPPPPPPPPPPAVDVLTPDEPSPTENGSAEQSTDQMRSLEIRQGS